ncbi:deoxyribose-phosphate aldolase [Ahniella affigens]|uniref:Deoxyribose-phosphate aldolase n=1 Tax=Ahniella affigens TaxID=2021234 RepID=A0A2P1PVR7_9GAMM|nr:deoxyribose-phosphate aldolase [Ahniella affigens]AVP98948.1 deoxyribose-phosphate aldolase [Ahniella affigens]
MNAPDSAAIASADLANLARRTLPLLDLTSLNEQDTPVCIRSLCERAATRFGKVAAVCVYPEHVHGARVHLAAIGSPEIRVATVVNFPDGSADPERIKRETWRAVSAGAEEIDLVIPWRSLLAGDSVAVSAAVDAARTACISLPLKVILETGELKDPALIRHAGQLAIDAGADFLKTSTGKVPINATPDAARVLCELIREQARPVGLKIAGGVRRTEDAGAYLAIIEHTLGAAFIHPARCRFGSSALLDDLQNVLSGQRQQARGGY